MIRRIALALAYLGSIPLAAYFVTNVGTQYDPAGPHVLPVWPGIEAPSGVYIIGLTLVLRDLLHRCLADQWRRPVMFTLIAIGAGLSALVSPTVALASAAAFAVSETVDYAVFSAAIKRLRFLQAVAVSNAISIVVDSLIFLAIAFGSLAYIEGQVIGKALATVAAVGVLWALRRKAGVSA